MTHKETEGGIFDYAAELGEDVLWQLTRIAQALIDLGMIFCVGALLYAAAASMTAQAGAKVKVDEVVPIFRHAPVSCGLTNDLLPPKYRTCQRMLEPES